MQRCLLVAAILAACNNSDSKTAGTGSSAAPGPKPIAGAPALPAGDPALGKCDVEFSGAQSVKYTAYNSKSAVLSDYWMNDTERSGLKLSPPLGKVLIIACRSNDAHVTISRPQTAPEIALGAHDYPVDNAGTAINVVANAQHTLLRDLTGVVHITAFDGSHIAGSVDVSGHAIKSTEPVHVTATFDYKCPGFAGCK